MLKNLPKQVAKLPKEIKKSNLELRIEKSYFYQRMEPIYVPFYHQLHSVFDEQRITFLKSRIIDHLWEKHTSLSKSYIERVIAREFTPNAESLYKTIARNYFKQYNLLKSTLLESKANKLTGNQRKTIKSIVHNINKHTKNKLSNHLYNYLQQGYSKNRAKNEINRLFKSMAWYRSDRISKTELTRAHNDSILDTKKSSGIKRKHWVLCDNCSDTGSCKICKANYKAGWISINKKFPSGHFMPPVHPNCSCGIR
jgi:hypothetical protein